MCTPGQISGGERRNRSIAFYVDADLAQYVADVQRLSD